MGRRHQGPRPKSLTLLDLWLNHHWALQHDWERAWHERLDLKRTPLYVAWPMLREILKERATSHSYAALASMGWMPADADRTLWALSQSGSKTRTTPPWMRPDPLTAKPVARTHHDRRLRGMLADRLGLDEQPNTRYDRGDE